MDWRFVDSNTLQETKTGYTIRLVSGTWFHPKEISPACPKGIDYLKQAQLLRCGLAYVNELCAEPKSQMA